MAKVYYSEILDFQYYNENFEGFSSARREYIKSISEKRRSAQSYFVWKLLLKVAKILNFTNFDYDLEVNKCICESLKISLTHSGSIVAVAISNDCVGVDVEKISDKILKLKNKLGFNIKEKELTAKYLTIKWTEKESNFKADNNAEFFSSKIINDSLNNQYVLTVASSEEKADFIKINFNEII